MVSVTFRNDTGGFDGVERPLTIGEFDGNTLAFKLAIETLQGQTGKQIASTSSSGSALTVHYTDLSTDGPFPLPVIELVDGGSWLNNTAYPAGALVDVPGDGIYLVLIAHTTPVSPAPFDPEATSGGDPIYRLISASDTGHMRDRGAWAPLTLYEVDDVVTNDDHGLFIVEIAHQSASTFDPEAGGPDALYRQLAGPITGRFSQVDNVAIETDPVYTVGVGDVGKYLRFSDECEIVFPDGDQFEIGDEIHFRDHSTIGRLSFVEGGSDVVLNPQREGFDTSTPWKGATVTAKYVATNEWDLIGPHGDEITA